MLGLFLVLFILACVLLAFGPVVALVVALALFVAAALVQS